MSEKNFDDKSAAQGVADGLDRRGFLKISSAVAATAAVAGTGLAAPAAKEKSQPTKRPAGAAKDLKGGWFII